MRLRMPLQFGNGYATLLPLRLIPGKNLPFLEFRFYAAGEFIAVDKARVLEVEIDQKKMNQAPPRYMSSSSQKVKGQM